MARLVDPIAFFFGPIKLVVLGLLTGWKEPMGGGKMFDDWKVFSL